MIKRILTGIILLLGASLSLHAQTDVQKLKERDRKTQLEMSRSKEIFSALLNNLSILYVDTIDMKSIFSEGMNSMLAGLDPYTNYLEQSETEDFKFMATGEYGGIGAFIQQRDSVVYVSNPMPNTPAERAGLKVGDMFVKIDTLSVIPSTNARVSNLLKGPVGTSVKVTIRRLGEDKEREITLVREKVIVDQVVHRGIYGDGVGYIRLSSFTDKSAQNVMDAFTQLRDTKKMKSLILDLRGNTGGVMGGAIEILSMFVPEKTLVVETKGRQVGTSQKYYTSGKVLDTKIPIAVLINSNSASSSEIVAGAMQDLDRAVLIGSKSFGKGLVQTTRPLPYKGLLKVTTARYHIPSGRCIQQIDYSHKQPDGSVAAVPDSLTTLFKTTNGREVRDGGGIRPDIEIKDEILPGIVIYMLRDGSLFEYAGRLFLKNPKVQSIKEIKITDEEFEGLVNFLEEKKFRYGEQSRKVVSALERLIEFEGYSESSKEAFEALKKQLEPNLKRDIVPHKKLISAYLKEFLAAYYFGMEAQYAVNMETDPTVTKAIEILSNPKEYNKILFPKK